MGCVVNLPIASISCKTKIMKSLHVIVAATMLVIASSCSAPKTVVAEAPAASLYDTKWSLKKIYADGVVQDVDTKAFIRFDKEKNSAGGNGSCNSFGSTTTINGSSVSLKNIFSTKMFCEAVQKTEDSFFSQLGKVTTYTIKGKTLQLLADNTVLLEFIAE